MTADESSRTIRKDIRELEVLDVRAATDYELFKSTLTLDEQMENSSAANAIGKHRAVRAQAAMRFFSNFSAFRLKSSTRKGALGFELPEGRSLP